MRTKKYIKVKHSTYIESGTKKQKRLFSIGLLALIIAISAIILAVQLGRTFVQRNNPYTNSIRESVEETIPKEEDVTKEETVSPEPTPTPVVTEDIQSSTRPNDAEGPFSVTYIADGDTIHISYYGIEMSLRLIGVDAPETVDPRTTVQCFGIEASNYLKLKLTGQQVYIESDPTQSNADKYGRLLRYVYLENEDIGLSIIANGYGHEYTYYIPYKKQSEYQAAERQAATSELGLWSPNTCAGITR